MRTKTKERVKRELKRFAEYMVSGGVWFWSGYILIVTLDDFIGLFFANFVGNAVGLTLNFLLGRYWVFDSKRMASLGTATKRYFIYTFINAFLLNYLILAGLKTGFGLGPEIGQFIAAAFFTPWNYLWYKYWVFKGRELPKRYKRIQERGAQRRQRRQQRKLKVESHKVEGKKG